jgi:hypothetical protein
MKQLERLAIYQQPFLTTQRMAGVVEKLKNT